MADPIYEEFALYCEDCSKRIYRSERCAELMYGEYMHLKCAREYFVYRCTECGFNWGSDVNDGKDEDEQGCPECDGKLEYMDEKERKKHIKGRRPDPL